VEFACRKNLITAPRVGLAASRLVTCKKPCNYWARAEFFDSSTSPEVCVFLAVPSLFILPATRFGGKRRSASRIWCRVEKTARDGGASAPPRSASAPHQRRGRARAPEDGDRELVGNAGLAEIARVKQIRLQQAPEVELPSLDPMAHHVEAPEE